MRKSRFDQAQVSEIVNLYGVGESLRAIGAKFGANAQTVRKLISNSGVIVRPRGRPCLSEQKSTVTTDTVTV